jgi:plastocyanin
MKNLFPVLLASPFLFLSACGDKDGADSGEDSDLVGNTPDHTVTTDDGSMDFMPTDLTIAVGDVVRFEMTATHNAIEVSQETYDNGGTEALSGGFAVDFGQTDDVTFTEAGVHWYICQPHVGMAMIGTITVE